MGNEGLLRSGLVIGLAFLISFMFSGCSISVPPLRKYAPLPQQLVPIKFISKDDSGLTKNTLDLDKAIAFGMTNNHALRIARKVDP